MAIAGFCETCQQYVWLNEQWGCVNGHAWDQIRNWYDPATGAPVVPYWLQPAPTAEPRPQPSAVPAPEPEPVPAPAPAPVPEPAPIANVAAVPAPEPAPASPRLELLAEILAMFGQYPNYRVQYGTDTDVVIDNQVADASWSTGKKKIEYSAVLKAVESEMTVYFWEILKEKGGGLNFGSFESESYSTVGKKRSGTTKQVTLGAEGVVVDATWDYGATRQIVESVAAARGWRVKTVLRKSSAQWK